MEEARRAAALSLALARMAGVNDETLRKTLGPWIDKGENNLANDLCMVVCLLELAVAEMEYRRLFDRDNGRRV
jgi:hypothetical protein